MYQYGVQVGGIHLAGPPAVVVAGLVLARGLQFAFSLCLLMPTGGAHGTGAGQEEEIEDIHVPQAIQAECKIEDTNADQTVGCTSGYGKAAVSEDTGDLGVDRAGVVSNATESVNSEVIQVGEVLNDHCIPIKYSEDLNESNEAREKVQLVDEQLATTENAEKIEEGTIRELLCDRHVLIFLFSMAVNGVAGTVCTFQLVFIHSDFLALGCMLSVRIHALSD